MVSYFWNNLAIVFPALLKILETKLSCFIFLISLTSNLSIIFVKLTNISVVSSAFISFIEFKSSSEIFDIFSLAF